MSRGDKIVELPLVDTHAHLDMRHFNKDRNEVIARALNAGVIKIVTVGADLESSQQAIKLAENHAQIYATVGFHPHEANRVKETDITRLAELARHPKVVAIGEIGLDFYRNLSPREIQFQALRWQLELAVTVDLPVIIHSRQAEKEMLAVLGDWSSHKGQKRNPIGVIHCFNGNRDTARKYLNMGFYISLGAYISYPSSTYMLDAIRGIPQDRLAVETDCPFLPPQSLRGKRNEPAYVRFTVDKLAEIRGASVEAIARQTTENAHRLFHIGD
jgi:TatD DNase family protein